MAMTSVNMPETESKPSKLERALSMFQMAGSLADIAGKGFEIKDRFKRNLKGQQKTMGMKSGTEDMFGAKHTAVKMEP